MGCREGPETHLPPTTVSRTERGAGPPTCLYYLLNGSKSVPVTGSPLLSSRLKRTFLRLLSGRRPYSPSPPVKNRLPHNLLRPQLTHWLPSYYNVTFIVTRLRTKQVDILPSTGISGIGNTETVSLNARRDRTLLPSQYGRVTVGVDMNVTFSGVGYGKRYVSGTGVRVVVGVT